MTHIFISYRRSDTNPFAGRLYDWLARAFGIDHVFKDVDNIPAGKNVRQIIREAVEKCNVMLVLIGPHWDSPRLHDPEDFVRFEIELGLHQAGCLVIPVLVNGAEFPDTNELPASINDLGARHAPVLRNDPDFHTDIKRLVAQIDPTVDIALPVSYGPEKIKFEVEFERTEVLMERTQQALWVSGIAFDRMVQRRRSTTEVLERGCEIRFLLASPHTSVIQNFEQYLAAARLNVRVQIALDAFDWFIQKYPEQFHIRLLPLRPSGGFFILDPDSKQGYMTFQPYLNQLDLVRHNHHPPVIELRKHDQSPWFDIFLQDFIRLWDISQDYDPNTHS